MVAGAVGRRSWLFRLWGSGLSAAPGFPPLFSSVVTYSWVLGTRSFSAVARSVCSSGLAAPCRSPPTSPGPCCRPRQVKSPSRVLLALLHPCVLGSLCWLGFGGSPPLRCGSASDLSVFFKLLTLDRRLPDNCNKRNRWR